MAQNSADQSPKRLDELIKEYEESGPESAEEHEGRKFLLDRMKWYWERYTDPNGYVLSQMKVLEEWQKYYSSRSAYKTTANDQSNWTFEGPSTSSGGMQGIGRVNVIEFHPTDPNTYWVGAATGGAWKTINNGMSWTPMTDDLPAPGVSDIDINPLNPQTIYLCTGDRDQGGYYGIGVMKSYNGGVTWNTTGMSAKISQYLTAACLEINIQDTNSLTLATNTGIYKSYDGGANWAKTKTVISRQVLYNPADTNILYATDMTGGIFRTADGGQTWMQVAKYNTGRRVQLAVTKAAPNYVYAAVVGAAGGLLGIYVSTDTGKTFQQAFSDPSCMQNLLAHSVYGSGCSGQGDYDLALAVSPLGPAWVFVGGINSWYSGDYGKTWLIMNQYVPQLGGVPVVHADKHYLKFHPLKPTTLFECNDGGIYRSDNNQYLTKWVDITNGLGITQFYRNAVSNTSGYVLGGAQDNGIKKLENGTSLQVGGGDGTECQIDYTDTGTYYISIQYGKLTRISSTHNTSAILIPGNPQGEWVTPFILSPHNPAHVFAGYGDLFFSSHYGDSMVNVTNGSVLPKISRIAMTAADTGTIYLIGGTASNLYVTHNFSAASATATFTKINVPYKGKITDIKIDSKDKEHFWITFNGFGSPQVVEYLSGKWAQVNSNLPDVHVSCIEQDTSNGILYIGTPVGVFYNDSINKQWEPYNTGLPVADVTDIGINYTTKEIWVSTYGRGMWKSPAQQYKSKDTSNRISDIETNKNRLLIYPNPARELVNVVLTEPGTVTIYDVQGRRIASAYFKRTGQVNLTAFKAGLYIIKDEYGHSGTFLKE